MYLSSDLNFELSEKEAKSLWSFLNSRERDLDLRLSGVMKRLESGLWDRFSIDDMAAIGMRGDFGDE